MNCAKAGTCQNLIAVTQSESTFMVYHILEKLIVIQVVKKFTAFLKIQRITNMFTEAHYWTLYQLPSQFMPRSTEWSLPSRFSNQNFVNITHF
jgi:hypothetical protein